MTDCVFCGSSATEGWEQPFGKAGICSRCMISLAEKLAEIDKLKVKDLERDVARTFGKITFRKIRGMVEDKIHTEDKINTPTAVTALATSNSSIVDKLHKLADLKKEGLITNEEYDQLKSQLISKK